MATKNRWARMAVAARHSVRGVSLTTAMATLTAIALAVFLFVNASETAGGPSSDESRSAEGALSWPVALEYEYTIVDGDGSATSERHIFYARSWDEWTDIRLHDAVAQDSGREPRHTRENDRHDDSDVVVKQYAPDGVETYATAPWDHIADHASAQLLDDIDVHPDGLFVERYGRGSAPNYMMNPGQVPFAQASSRITSISPLPVDQYVREEIANELGIERESLVGRRYKVEEDERAVVYSPGLDVPLWAQVTFANGGSESMQVVGVPAACESVTCGLSGTD